MHHQVLAPSAPFDGDTVIDIVAKLLIAVAERRGLPPNKLVGLLSDQAMAELYRMALRSTFDRAALAPGAAHGHTDSGGPSSVWERWLSSRRSGARAQLCVVSGFYAS
ncbi:hypothetical protein GCM10018793_31540 [Streptomyces sulfonofaciens]|uniref:Uncharacterized protein n=1 Tax=Streptomyces sulfonofaciens TaxID=68272 RepID=A0A919L0S2_9ACTN|nr:hypothetical protein GCM10018793_31540 [Streptomyces sulfonofaciens]